MVKVRWSRRFRNIFANIKDQSLKTKIQKQIEKIRANPKVGKPMGYDRRGTRELRVKPFRLSYKYLPIEGLVYIVDLYHKKKQ